ncbi:MAG: hypothetical protein C0494_06030 [Sphingobium sp.]|nr:hypothetical protein [Sphingobium sp.]
MKPRNGSPIQFALPLEQREAMEQEIEARVARRASEDALIWRFRLVTIEAIMMAGLVIAAGLCLGKPLGAVLRAGLIVGGTCFASGMLLLGCSAGVTRIGQRVRAWIRRARP